MSELAIAALRFGLLLALWILIVSIVTSQGRDLIVGKKNKMRLQRAQGTAPAQGAGSAARTAAPVPTPAASAAAPVAASAPTSAPTSTPVTPTASAPAPKLARRLHIVAGPAKGQVLDLQGTALLMGRAQDAGLVLDDDYASGRHARLFPQGTRWFLEDLGSTNGTYVADTAVTRALVVAPGDRIRIGKTVMELEA
ncbi:MAG: FHA domain-containing protein [Micrococcus sp.]|nr:FHA domain-containing protein [Micrococcus sp.]